MVIEMTRLDYKLLNIRSKDVLRILRKIYSETNENFNGLNYLQQLWIKKQSIFRKSTI